MLVIFGALKAPWLLIVAFFLIVLPAGALFVRARRGGSVASGGEVAPESSGHG